MAETQNAGGSQMDNLHLGARKLFNKNKDNKEDYCTNRLVSDLLKWGSVKRLWTRNILPVLER